MTQHTPTKHSNIVGGSSAARVLNCPASVRLVQKMPAQEESTFAAEGTALHNAVEHCLYEGLEQDGLVEYLIGKEFYGFELDKEMAEAVAKAVEMFDALWVELEEEDGEVTTYAIEVQCQFPGIPDAFGTADILMVTPKRSIVLDWKFGKGVIVSAHENRQMAFYARAAAHSAPQFFWPEGQSENDKDAGKRDVEFIIAQPRISEEPSRYKVKFADLVGFEEALKEAVSKIDDEIPPMSRGDHCRWCTAMPICPAYKNAAAKLDQLVAKAKEDPDDMSEAEYSEAVPSESEVTVTPELMSEWLAKADVVESWAASVRKLVMEQAQAGIYPKGLKLVDKLGNLSYVDPDKADKMLANKGLTAAERRKTVPITPTQANALLKKKGKPLLSKKQADRFVSGVVLVDESDPRPAVRTIADRAAEAAKKLEAQAAE